ncbi:MULTISPECIES: serine protease inhibitor ecotin [Serratia]|jgi:ecotin|uniref:Ecotin n=1 Tax=Serratia fonticola TaxID=47917 RepID=A0AAE7JUF1_SERFO|nr:MULTISPECIES: serine protease inhibitor ecotin [Serratia]ATM74496.1 ecotin [Serratia fonticola]MBC3216117.1 serine protease inhibitor ecotin [Serratia fonticola]MBC3229624.1 serine protease inhibitor ecotin [Serratia fonticola]NBJ33728.1 serine protease inhibitor ecotin [Serratia fonticola]NCG54094.1 serine protease inhibitor ecotin [Serratia fonticola]
MNKLSMVVTSLLMAASVSAVAATTASTDDLNMQPLEKVAPFPKAEPGMSRQVIYLPKQENEENFKVELLIGQTLEVDCNRHMMGGNLESKTLAGWGYNYFVLPKLSAPASTMMACPDNTKRQEFVAAQLGDAAMQRYNSRLPIVVYVPKDVEVRYRIWSASENTGRAVTK